MSIREALRELELWGAGTSFSLTGYSDSASKELMIIKDWKELVNQVGVACVPDSDIRSLELGSSALA